MGVAVRSEIPGEVDCQRPVVAVLPGVPESVTLPLERVPTDQKPNQLYVIDPEPQNIFALNFASVQLSGPGKRPTVILGQDSGWGGRSVIDPMGGLGLAESNDSGLGAFQEYPVASFFQLEDAAGQSELEFRSQRPAVFSLSGKVMQDYRNFYSPGSLQFLGAGFLAGAAMANTNVDREIDEWAYDRIKNNPSGHWYKFVHGTKDLGDGRYTLPLYAGVWALSQLTDQSPGMEMAGEWGQRSIRGFVVGAPFVAVTQMATGGSRPYEVASESNWRPFRDNNGVSGHAFMGSLPFLTAAMMADDVRWKSAFFLASFATPLSRLSDGAHYPSQIFLGWWAACAAAQAVSQTQAPDRNFRILPYFADDGGGVMFQWDY